jgi:hypothetical protein
MAFTPSPACAGAGSREWACRPGATPPMRITAAWSRSRIGTYRIQVCKRDVPRARASSPRIIVGNVTVTIDNREAPHVQTSYRHPSDEPSRAPSAAPRQAASAKPSTARGTSPAHRPTAYTLDRGGGCSGRPASGIPRLAGQLAAEPRKLDAGRQAAGHRRPRPAPGQALDLEALQEIDPPRGYGRD